MKQEENTSMNPFEFLCLDEDIDDAILMKDNKILLLNCKRGIVLGEKVKVTINPNKFNATILYGSVVDYEQTEDGLDVIVQSFKHKYKGDRYATN